MRITDLGGAFGNQGLVLLVVVGDTFFFPFWKFFIREKHGSRIWFGDHRLVVVGGGTRVF